MLWIYVEQVSERLIYTFDFVFKERGITYSITNDLLYFENLKEPRFNYSEMDIAGVLHLIPSSLLFDEEIQIYSVTSAQFKKEDCLAFNTVIDPFASIFYVISRMEEYTSTLEDNHGRFESKNSVLSRFNWLQKAVCDRWSIAILNVLQDNHLIEFKNTKNQVKICPTFDIDNVYAYQLKKGVRQYLSTARDIIQSNRIRLNERKQVLSGARLDPYDTYDYILSVADKGFDVKMFWLLGDYGKYDKNVSYRNIRHQRLIRKMALKTTVGIHPSYRSNNNEYYLRNEVERLEKILNRQVLHSRQHFLRLKISSTYSNLIKCGISHDYTMGYADQIGFRAGTARPFKWFDLNKNRTTELTIHPFVYMDGTLNEYMNLTISDAKVSIESLFKEIKKFGGEMTFIWHNETISNYGKWEGWRDVLEFSLNLNESNE